MASGGSNLLFTEKLHTDGVFPGQCFSFDCTNGNLHIHSRPAKREYFYQLLYWLAAAFMLFFLFSNNRYDLRVRIPVVIVLVLMGWALTRFVNRILIPEYLFKARYFLFVYLSLMSVIITVWANSLAIMIIMWFTAVNDQGVLLPGKADIMLLIAGCFIMILFAAFTHFTRETYRKQVEKERLAAQKAVSEQKLAEVKLRMLQSQLHPHFLYNMLNNLNGLWMERSDATPEVILRLSEMLDYMLHDCSDERIPLTKEIHLIKNYIELERIRHDDRLHLELEIPENCHDCQIAPLLLFPLVENAFKHGDKDLSGERKIGVSLQFNKPQLRFCVENTYNSEKAGRQSGTGLKNLRERLEIIYPGKHNFVVDSNNQYFRAVLELETEKFI